MRIPVESPIELSRSALTSVAKRVLETDVELLGDPSIEPIGQSSIGATTLGIFRVTGQARVPESIRSWSAVVKVLTQSDMDIPGREVDPATEVEIYRSSLFADPAAGMRAAACYNVEEIDDRILLWLEDLTASPHPPWPASQFIETAGHLGRFFTRWPAQRLADRHWLGVNGLRQKYAREVFSIALTRLPSMLDNPLVAQMTPPDVADETLHYWANREQLFAAVEALPRGIVHADCHPGNLFPVPAEDGQGCTVVIDWAEAGLGEPGVDVAHLLATSLQKMELSLADAIALLEPMLDAHTRGLIEGGWQGDLDRVRLAYHARLGCQAFNSIAVLLYALDIPKVRAFVEASSKATFEEVAVHRGRTQPFFLNQLSIAHQLLGAI